MKERECKTFSCLAAFLNTKSKTDSQINRRSNGWSTDRRTDQRISTERMSTGSQRADILRRARPGYLGRSDRIGLV